MNLTSVASFASLKTGLNTTASASRDAMAARQEAKLKDAQSALQTLSTTKSTASDEKKAAAKQKVEEIKARIRMLKMAMPSDPRMAARMSAQLARELGAAVKAYAAAGGAATGMAPSTVAASEGTASDAASSSGTADIDARDAAAAEGAATAPEVKPDTNADTGAASGETKDGKDASAESRAAEDPYRKIIAAQEERAAIQSRQNESKRADSEFMTDVKRLATELKSIIAQAASKARQKSGGGSDPEVQAAQKAAAEMEKEISNATQSMSGSSGATAGIGISLTV